MRRNILLGLACLLLGTAISQPTQAEKEQEISPNDLQFEGRGIRDMAKNVWSFFFGHGDDYEDYADYYDFNPNDVSSYTWYNPGSARKDDLYDVAGEEEYSWGELAMGAAAAVIPMALLLSALPAGLFTVAIKKRSFSDDSILDQIDPTELPLLRSLQEGDLLALVRPQCQKKLFCELTQLGKRESASFLQRGFYFLSEVIPENMAKRLRIHRLLAFSRENQCARFSCHVQSKNPGLHESPSNHLKAPNDKDSQF